jgi:hypothetical protein
MKSQSPDHASEIENARKLIEEARSARTSACLAEINQVLSAHNCRMEPAVTIRGQSMTWQLAVIPND